MLIVDKPMPKNCCDCALDCCWVTGTMPFEYAEKRKPNCPIKGELPDEHGDLIDRDALKKQCGHDDGFDLWVSHTEIDQQPIVIAAERKDNETN